MDISLKRIFGIFLIIIGIAGLFLPLVPGILLIVVGLLLLKSRAIIKLYKRFFKKRARFSKG